MAVDLRSRLAHVELPNPILRAGEGGDARARPSTALIGVDPARQGRGLGSALMKHTLALCDAEGALAYLESSNPRNVPLYERHGFEVVGEIRPADIPLTGEARTALSANPASLVATLREESYHAARERVIKQFEKQYLTWLVSRAGGNMSKAARIAGVDRTTLYRLMERHGLQRNPGAAWLVEREAEAPMDEDQPALPPEGAA